MIIKCTCTDYKGNKLAATYQDGRYGQGMRVHTPIAKEPKGTHWRCTICNVERSKGSAEDSKKKK